MGALNQVISEIVATYRTLEECKAIALVGSQARGTAKQWSDINLMCVCFSHPEPSSRMLIIKAIADPGSPFLIKEFPIATDTFTKAGSPVMIWHISQDTICDRVASIEKRRRLESTMLIASLFESQILWDPRNQLAVWKNEINPIPEEYLKHVVPLIFSEVTTIIEDLGSSKIEPGVFYIHHEIIIGLEDIYEILFLLNGFYLNFSPRIDAILGNLKLVPASFSAKVKELLNYPSDARGLRLRWRLLADITKSVGDLIVKQGRFDIEDGMTQLKKSAPFLFGK
jgi:hypothetical protein